jgi:hypothetical protein
LPRLLRGPKAATTLQSTLQALQLKKRRQNSRARYANSTYCQKLPSRRAIAKRARDVNLGPLYALLPLSFREDHPSRQLVNRGNRRGTSTYSPELIHLIVSSPLEGLTHCLETRQPTSFGPSWSPMGFSIRKRMSGAYVV